MALVRLQHKGIIIKKRISINKRISFQWKEEVNIQIKRKINTKLTYL